MAWWVPLAFGGPIDDVAVRLLADRPLAEWKALPAAEAGEAVYRLVYADDAPHKPPVPRDALYAGFFAYPRACHLEDWLMRFGAAGQVEGSDAVRVYVNALPSGAVALADGVATGLDARRIPFDLKVPSSVDEFGRTSAFVLYVRTADYPAARDVVVRWVEAHPEAVGEAATPLAKPLARGVAAAMEPDAAHAPETRKQHSFGTVVADVFGEAIVAVPDGADARAVAEAVRARFRSYGLDPERPWLRAGVPTDPL